MRSLQASKSQELINYYVIARTGKFIYSLEAVVVCLYLQHRRDQHAQVAIVIHIHPVCATTEFAIVNIARHGLPKMRGGGNYSSVYQGQHHAVHEYQCHQEVTRDKEPLPSRREKNETLYDAKLRNNSHT